MRAPLVRQHVAVHLRIVQARAAAVWTGAHVAAVGVRASASGSAQAVLEEMRLDMIFQELLLPCTRAVSGIGCVSRARMRAAKHEQAVRADSERGRTGSPCSWHRRRDMHKLSRGYRPR